MNRISFLLFLLVLSAGNAFGQLWQQTNGVGGDGTRAIAVNSQGHIFVASAALHRSTDGGVTWKQIFLNLPGTIGKIVVQPTGRIIVAISYYDGFNYSFPAFYFSDDNGDNWHDMSVKATYFSQSETGALYRILDRGVWQSLDNGTTWDSLSTEGIIGNKTFATRDYAGDIFICGEYLYRSSDNGTSWSKIVNGISLGTSYVSCSPYGKLFAVVSGYAYASSDEGRTWNKLANTSGFVSAHYDKKGGTFFLIPNSNQNIIYSSDSGATWKFSPIGKDNPVDMNCFCGAIEPSGNFLLAVNDHLSRFNPSDFENVQLLSVPNGQINSIIASPNSILAFTSRWCKTNIHSFAWQTMHDGNQWTLCNTDNAFQGAATGYYGISGLAMDSLLTLYAINGAAIIRSSSGGLSWSTLPASLTNEGITALAFAPDNTFFVSTSVEGIFRSTDKGSTWDQCNSGIDNQQILSLVISNNSEMYAGGIQALYHSTNNGNHWEKLPIHIGDTLKYVLNLSLTQKGIFLAASDSIICWSSDNGITWKKNIAGLNNPRIYSLLSTPSGKTFAATTNGVFYIDDPNVDTWHQFADGLTTKNVISLCIDQKGYLFAGTDVSGVFKSTGKFGTTTHSKVGLIDLTTHSITMPGKAVGSTVTVELPNVLKSTGTGPITVNGKISTVFGMPNELTISQPTFPISIEPGSAQSISVTFQPLTAGNHKAIIYLSTINQTDSIVVFGSASFNNSVADKDNVSQHLYIPPFPNPFSYFTTIPFILENTSQVQLDIIDQFGRVVESIANDMFEAGPHEVAFNAIGLSAGVYHVRLRAEGKSEMRTIVKTSEP
jgi:photosystem II stability/assembly factor-like uncharacterized protein